MKDVPLVFHGTVIERKTLPPRRDMMGRGRYATTFRVNEYWKGSPGPRVILYGVDSLSDCLHGDEYKVGKNYLIYAEEGEVGKFVWYGLTGVVPEGTKILVPESCAPDGETSEDRKGLDHALGKGRIPQKIE